MCKRSGNQASGLTTTWKKNAERRLRNLRTRLRKSRAGKAFRLLWKATACKTSDSISNRANPCSRSLTICPQAARSLRKRTRRRTTRRPTRAADVVGQLDVLLLKALNGASGEINAEDVAKAAAKAKLPKEIRESLRSLAETAKDSLAALDKFTGKDLAAAMEKAA